MPEFGYPAPDFDDTYTYLAGISDELDDSGDFTLSVTIAASQIIGIQRQPAVYDRDGNRHTRVNILVPGLRVGMVNAKYNVLLEQWKVVNAVFRYPPGSKPADVTRLAGALQDIQGLTPPVNG